ncbi:PLD nuclease N-terminal domain-containing protein [Agromyces sp. SYSU T00266]|uniref:PLD nuclease N-terminal domain-containing protein n=1 Tax=Agromyces zhanjiangensis TaxID=3158562 RepID=UPI003398E67B
MVRLWLIAGVAAVVFTIYAAVDCALFDRTRIRGLPRGWWIVVILLVPVIGAALWFIVGRGRAVRVGRVNPHSNAPDDDPEFLRRLRADAEHQERIRRLEQELEQLDHELDADRDDGAHGADGHGAASPRGDDALGTDRRRNDGTDGPGDSGPSGLPNG